MQPKRRDQIRSHINAYANGDTRHARHLTGSEFLRIRVGNWRVIMTDDGIVVVIIRIGARGDVYENL